MDDFKRNDLLSVELERLVLAHRVLQMEGHEDLTLGHMSWRDADGRGFWMKLQGLALGEIRTAEDLVLLDFDGNVLEGDGRWLHAEWPLHPGVYRARDDVMAVGHTHPFYSCAFSSTNEPLKCVAHEGAFFGGNVPHFNDTSDLINSRELADAMAQTMDDANGVFIRNHGVTFCGHSIQHATLMGIFLEKACRHQILMDSSGMAWTTVPPDEIVRKQQWLKPEILEASWRFYCRKLKTLEAAHPSPPVSADERIAPWLERFD
ncbi:MAG: class II aldolase/adducin family protein [Alphaproteobacteria bacterium]